MMQGRFYRPAYSFTMEVNSNIISRTLNIDPLPGGLPMEEIWTIPLDRPLEAKNRRLERRNRQLEDSLDCCERQLREMAYRLMADNDPDEPAAGKAWPGYQAMAVRHRMAGEYLDAVNWFPGLQVLSSEEESNLAAMLILVNGAGRVLQGRDNSE